jgi:hypothetical protein
MMASLNTSCVLSGRCQVSMWLCRCLEAVAPSAGRTAPQAAGQQSTRLTRLSGDDRMSRTDCSNVLHSWVHQLRFGSCVRDGSHHEADRVLYCRLAEVDRHFIMGSFSKLATAATWQAPIHCTGTAYQPVVASMVRVEHPYPLSSSQATLSGQAGAAA